MAIMYNTNAETNLNWPISFMFSGSLPWLVAPKRHQRDNAHG